MTTLRTLVAILLACAAAGNAQMGRTTDWWTYAGDAQRTGWEKNEQKFTRDDVPKFQLLWKMKLRNQQQGLRSLLPPVIVGNLIGSRGFKELAFVAGSSDSVWVIDADLAKMYWEKHFDTALLKPHIGNLSGSCTGLLTAMPTLPAPITFRFRPPAAAGAAPASQATPGAQGSPNASPGSLPGPQSTPAASATTPASGANSAPGSAPRQSGVPAAPPPAPLNPMFRVRPIYVLSSDGKLHRLNQDDGSDLQPTVSFLPPNANAHSLNFGDQVVYATTSESCGGAPNAVWAIDLSEPNPTSITFFVSNGGGFRGLGGPALGTNGTVYVQTGDGELDPAANKFANTLLALTAKELRLKDYVILPHAGSTKEDVDMNVTSPVVFNYKDRELIATAGKDGRLYLLDANSLGGEDHKTPLFQTAPISVGNGNSPEHGIWGSLSSWEATDGTRYVLAPVWGPLHPDLKSPITNGDAPNGSIVAFKVEEQQGQLMLIPAWVSRDMSSPAPPVIAEGVVFALSNGQFHRKIDRSKGAAGIEEQPVTGAHATLYALDGATGKEIYSTGDQVTAPGTLTGLSLANGRLYFTTTDNTVNVFGKYLETGRN